jgi:hypothetical protein
MPLLLIHRSAMLPGSSHLVATLENTLAVGVHTYSYATMKRTAWAMQQQHFFSHITNNAEHQDTCTTLLQRMVHYAHQHVVENADWATGLFTKAHPHPAFRTTPSNLSSLLTLVVYADFLGCDPEKDRKWLYPAAGTVKFISGFQRGPCPAATEKEYLYRQEACSAAVAVYREVASYLCEAAEGTGLTREQLDSSTQKREEYARLLKEFTITPLDWVKSYMDFLVKKGGYSAKERAAYKEAMHKTHDKLISDIEFPLDLRPAKRIAAEENERKRKRTRM